MPFDFAAKYETGLRYSEFLEKYGTEDQRTKWKVFFENCTLSPHQLELLGGFSREMKILVMAGAWCGDCVQQCPFIEHFARATPCIQVRYFDRDANPDLAAELRCCGAARVPAVVFLAEDGEPCGRYGDRTLSKYRQMAKDHLGPSCPSGIGAPPKELVQATMQDWLDEFERIQLMLRLSSRLRQKHGD